MASESPPDPAPVELLVPGQSLSMNLPRRIGSSSRAVTSAKAPVRVGVQRSAARTSERINEQVRSETMQNFHNLCTRLNIDPLDHASIHAALILFSRAFSKLGPEDPVMQKMPDAIARLMAHVDWPVVEKLRQKPPFTTIHDWSSLILYLAVSSDSTDLRSSASAKNVLAAMDQSGIAAMYGTGTSLVLHVLLHMAVAPTPQEKMLERLFAQHARSQGLPPPHDLELRCLKLLTHCNNTLPDPLALQADLLLTLQGLVPSPAYTEEASSVVARAAAAVIDSASERQAARSNARLRLRYFVKEIDNSGASYDRSFANWANQQRFPITTSIRMQQVLYLLRVQNPPAELQHYTPFFPEAVVQRVMSSTVGAVDYEVVHAVISHIRTYRHNIADLIDFRAECLNGISHSIRSNLTLSQIVQLYICAFQHPSVREQLWRRVVNVWNHSIQSAIVAFAAAHEFDLSTVLSTLMANIASVGPAQASTNAGNPGAGRV
tara:strand:- start:3788 stop:5260 length:1473 start_codon:yes stop_codon:yes gene_type:complete